MKLFQFDIYDAALALSNIFTVFISKKYFMIFGLKCKNVHVTKLIYILFCIAIMISSLIIDIPIVNLLTTIIAVLAIAFSYKNNLNKTLLIVAFYGFIFFTGELISAAVTGRTNIHPLIKGEYNDVFGLLLCDFLTLLIVLLLQDVKFYKGKNNPPLIYLITTLLMPASSIAIGAIIMSIEGTTKLIVLFSMGILIMMNILTFTLYDRVSLYYEKQMELASLKQENIFYFNQLKAMDESVKEVRSFRHDIINHFNMVEEYLKCGKTAEAALYLHELNASGIISDAITSNTGNFVIDSILNYKLSTVQTMDIDIKAEIFVPTSINIDTVHFVSILSNLLDNSIEALKTMNSDEYKFLRIRIAYSKGRLMIHIQNSYDGDIIYKDGLICSSKSDSKVHGFGLNNVYKAVEAYDGLLKISHENGIFSARVLLYLK